MHPHFKASKLELISLLNSLSVPLQSNSKLSAKELNERLELSLDNSQCREELSDFFGSDSSRPINNLGTLPLFKIPDGEDMQRLMQRTTLEDSDWYDMPFLHKKNDGSITPEKRKPFTELRGLVAAFGWCAQEKCDRVVIQDQAQTSLIIARIIEVRQAVANVPAIIIVYSHLVRTETNLLQEVGKFAEDIIDKERCELEGSVLAQHLLLRLLDLNAHRVPSTFVITRRKPEENQPVSFLVPLEPLKGDQRDSMATEGCAVCGKTSTQVCGSCRRIRYCSPEHAKSHWKAHKPSCKNLSNSTWITVPFSDALDPESGMYSATINRTSDTFTIRDPASQQALPNIHESNPFLLKVQMSILTRLDMMIYDQKRSITSNIVRSRTPLDTWNTLERLMQDKGTRGGLKIYVWAKRKSDWELSIAVDHVPNQNVGW